ncbi:hypothetical protein EDD18DRAFT_1113080 [Armillaria luteobubalina]|uniref:Uncharacterized protein n=1 Tax=Armillaria luteobubalina TaxID=153913 RepID=A0AA39PCD8_9AGAR|nr:hypothetical protein EDD18DRAFT_1113080 [Armillaria luteobubalina]
MSNKRILTNASINQSGSGLDTVAVIMIQREAFLSKAVNESGGDLQSLRHEPGYDRATWKREVGLLPSIAQTNRKITNLKVKVISVRILYDIYMKVSIPVPQNDAKPFRRKC